MSPVSQINQSINDVFIGLSTNHESCDNLDFELDSSLVLGMRSDDWLKIKNINHPSAADGGKYVTMMLTLAYGIASIWMRLLAC